MACIGVHFAITPQQKASILEAGSDAAVLHIVQEELESAWDAAKLCATDKAWDAIHRCLVGGPLADDGSVLAKCVLGGQQLYRGGDYIVSYRSSRDVLKVTAALAGIDKERLRHLYRDLREHGYAGPIGDDDFEYTWAHFASLRDFYRDAARLGRAVLFSVDQ